MRSNIKYITVGLVALTMSACTAVPFAPKVPPVSSLGDAVLAVQFSNFYEQGTKKGTLVLVSKSGETRSLKVGMRDMGQPIWSRTGLVVAGEKRWFHIAEKITSGDLEERMGYDQYTGLSAPDGTIQLFFNGGFAEDDHYNLWRLHVDSSGQGQFSKLPGYPSAFASCPQGVAIVASSDSRLTDDTSSTSPSEGDQALYTAGESGTFIRLGKRPKQPHSNAINTVPCNENGIHILRGVKGSPTPNLLIWKWTGASTLTRINTIPGWDVTMADTQPEFVNGKVRSCDINGMCVDVNPKTAHAVLLTHIMPEWEHHDVSFLTKDNHTYALVLPEEEDADAVLWVVNEKNHAWQEVMRLPHFSTHSGPTGMVMRGIAMKPGWTPLAAKQ